MKKFLFFIVLILIALLLILNWKQRHEIVCCAKQKSEQVKECAKETYQKGKGWVDKQSARLSVGE